MSFILNIDTSMQNASVSIAKNGQIIKAEYNDIQKSHASFIHVATKQLLAEVKISTTDLSAIGVTLGPGSYTGLRVGLAAAKGLCYALKIPLIGVGTLEAMAKTKAIELSEKDNTYLCPMIDARRMEVFTAIYDGEMNEIVAPHAKILDSSSFLTDFLSKKIFFFGDGADKWKGINVLKNAIFLEEENISNALNVLTFERFCRKDFANLTYATPLYVKEFYNP
jgi:tRNA threonylcarbamoyladenosine biosynthesis protein TsaB